MVTGDRLRVLWTLIVLAGMFMPADPARAGQTRNERSVEHYSMPDVFLVNQNGKKVRFKKLIEQDKPVVVDFIYGTCTTICPILSAGYSSLQRKLADPTTVQLISISIDPEHDTPKVMRDYLKKYQSKPGWDFLTGTREDIDQVMRAFDAYVSDKMYHQQVTFIRAPGRNSWVRVKGLMSSAELMSEYQKAGGK